MVARHSFTTRQAGLLKKTPKCNIIAQLNRTFAAL